MGLALKYILYIYIYLFFSLVVADVERVHDIDPIDTGSNLSTSKRVMPVYTGGKITSMRSNGPSERSKPGCLCRWVRAEYLTTKLSLRLHGKI